MKAALTTVLAVLAVLAIAAAAPVAYGDGDDILDQDGRIVKSFTVQLTDDGFKLDGKAATVDEIGYIGAGSYVVAYESGDTRILGVLRGSFSDFLGGLIVPGTSPTGVALKEGTVELSNGVLSWEGVSQTGVQTGGTADVGVMIGAAEEGKGTFKIQDSPATWGKHDYMAAFAAGWSVVYKGSKVLASNGEVPDLGIESVDGKLRMSWEPGSVIFVGVEEDSWTSDVNWVAVAVAAIGAIAAVIGIRYHPAVVVLGAAVTVFGVVWALGFIDPPGFVDDLLNGNRRR